MKKWEYRITTEAEDLFVLGEQGWELVAVCPKDGALVHYLKRPAPGLAEEITLDQRRQLLERPNGGRKGADR